LNDHAFLAVDFTNDERHGISAALTEASTGSLIPGRRTSAQSWHITLRFLGECTDSQADRIVHSLSEAHDLDAGQVWCDGLDAFPRPSKASVVYLRIDDPTGTLSYLAAVCDEAAVDAGFESEGRPFVPHVTLSRLRPAIDVRGLIGSFGEFRSPITVRGIALMRNRGAHYETVDTVLLS
jgi:2'-5' RNA ligase